MKTAMATQQRGLTLSGFIFTAFVLVIVGITLLKLIPAYVQNSEINGIFRDIAHDPDMQKATLHDIKDSYSRRSSVDDITAISVDDIVISNDGNGPVLSANYAVKVPLIGNISIYMEFNPSSASR